MRKIVVYKKGDFLGRKARESTSLRHYYAVEEKEISRFNGVKGFLLFILFPPLVFFGWSKLLEVTYELKPEYDKEKNKEQA